MSKKGKMLKAYIEKNHTTKLNKDMGLLSDHFPMALQALVNLNATPEVISRFAKSKLSENSELNPESDSKIVINASNWKVYLGKRVHAPAYVDFFMTEIGTIQVKPTLLKYLPVLITGSGSAAFHGLIRLAYALELQLTSELAHALAAWTCTYQSLGTLPSSGKLSLPESYAGARKARLFEPSEISGKNIIQRMVTVSRNSQFIDLVGSLDRDQLKLSELASVAIHLYLSSAGDFTALHAVTSAHALRLVLAYLTPEMRSVALANYWQAVLAAAITFGTPDPVILPTGKFDITWEEIFARACLSTDDHVLKLVYSCYEESKAYGTNQIYKIAAFKKAAGEI